MELALGSLLCPTSARYMKVTMASYRDCGVKMYREAMRTMLKMCSVRFTIEQQWEFLLKIQVNSPSVITLQCNGTKRVLGKAEGRNKEGVQLSSERYNVHFKILPI